jgi:hypothetical protein
VARSLGSPGRRRIDTMRQLITGFAPQGLALVCSCSQRKGRLFTDAHFRGAAEHVLFARLLDLAEVRLIQCIERGLGDGDGRLGA